MADIDYAKLNAARRELRDLTEALTHTGIARADPQEAMVCGMVAATAEAAEHLIFEVLNIMSNMADDPAARAAIDTYHGDSPFAEARR